jgi:hypothetical protein
MGRGTSPAQQSQTGTARSAGKKAVRKKTASRKAKLARAAPEKDEQRVEIKQAGLSLLRQRRPCSKFRKAAGSPMPECFSKRYGSAARASKAKVKK